MRMLLASVALLLLLTSPARAEDGWLLHAALGAYMTLNGVDLSETMFLLGANQGREANRIFSPLSTNPVLFGAAKIGLDSAAVYGILRIHKDHPRLAWMLTGLGIAVETAATAHNAKLLR